eukprot:gene12050-14098_t
MSLLRTVVSRSTIFRPRLTSTAFLLRGKDPIAERENALETEFVRSKEKDDLRKFKQAQQKQEEDKKSKEKVTTSAKEKNNKKEEIESLEDQIEALQKKVDSLKKSK